MVGQSGGCGGRGVGHAASQAEVGDGCEPLVFAVDGAGVPLYCVCMQLQEGKPSLVGVAEVEKGRPSSAELQCRRGREEQCAARLRWPEMSFPQSRG